MSLGYVMSVEQMKVELLRAWRWLKKYIFGPFIREEIEAAKTLLFGLSAGAGVSSLGSSSAQSIPSTARKSASAQSSHSTVAHSTSKLNSKRAGGESNSEGEDEDLGFGDPEYFHDSKYGEEVN